MRYVVTLSACGTIEVDVTEGGEAKAEKLAIELLLHKSLVDLELENDLSLDWETDGAELVPDEDQRAQEMMTPLQKALSALRAGGINITEEDLNKAIIEVAKERGIKPL